MWPRGKTRLDPRPANVRYAMLRRASLPRRWLLAAAAGAIFGAVLGFGLGWWLAPLATTVIMAGLLLCDRHFGVLGAWPGDEGCHRLAAAVARLERHGWSVLHAPTIPGQEPGRTVYLLVGPSGVVVVEHHVWPAGERVATSPTTGLFEVAGRPAARRTSAVRAAAAAVAEALSDALSREIPILPVLAIHGLALDHPRVTAGVTLLPIADLAREIRRRPALLSIAEVDTVAATARRLFTRGAS